MPARFKRADSVPESAPENASKKTSQKGAALLVVLLLVASLSFIVLALTADARRAVERSTEAARQRSAHWYAQSLEVISRLALEELEAQIDATPTVYSLDNPAFLAPIDLPLPEGAASVQLADAGRCFNLNSLSSSGSAGGLQNALIQDGDPAAPGQEGGAVSRSGELSGIVQALGLGEADGARLIDVVTDWVDDNTIRESAGAEDDFYTALPVPFRTGATALADVSELRAMEGVNRVIYQALRPYLCALPTRENPPLNVNMLRRQDAPLLTALTGGALEPTIAADMIANRPVGGWTSLDAFWSEPALQGVAVDDGVRSAGVSLRSEYIAVRGLVRFNGTEARVQLLFRVADGNISLLSRELGS